MAEKGMVIVVSAPSGTGKGAIIKEIMANDRNIRYSISATTRLPRKGEKEGKDYFFLNRREFEEQIKNGELAEWDEYCSNYYGTPKKYIDNITKQGNDVILEITVPGAVDVKKSYKDAVMIYVLPPSMEELEKRIKGRGTEDENSIKKRLDKAYSEIKYLNKYEYVVVNDDLSRAAEEVRMIINAERKKYKRNLSILGNLYKGELK